MNPSTVCFVSTWPEQDVPISGDLEYERFRSRTVDIALVHAGVVIDECSPGQ